MKIKITRLLITKDGWPLEEIEGKPITNFIRRFIHGDHYECRDCWYSRRAAKNTKVNNNVFQSPTTITKDNLK